MGVAAVLATRNPAKANQLRELLVGLDVELLDGASFQGAPDVEEEGGSHLAIAIGKAMAWSRSLGALVVASDGGLSIPALGDGWSSLITRRGTGADVPDEERARRLLRRMRDLEGERRACWWTEALAVARAGELIGAWEANGLEGYIAHDFLPPEGGTNGFWVSGLWVTQDGLRRWSLTEEDTHRLGDPWASLREPLRGLFTSMSKKHRME